MRRLVSFCGPILALTVAIAAEAPSLRLRTVVLRPGGTPPPVPEALTAPPIEQGGAALVLFHEGTTPVERRAAVEDVGGTWGAYVPDSGAMVLLPPAAAEKLRARPEVALVAAYAPAWKVAPEAAGGSGPRDLVVSLHPWAVAHRAIASIEAAGGVVTDRPTAPLMAPTLRVSIPGDGLVEAIARIDEVRWIEPAPRYVLTNDRSRWIVQSNQPDVFSVHDRGLRGQGQILAGMDTGLDKNHCCFNIGRRVDAYTAYGVGNRRDDAGHGTHVFGTAGCSEPAGVYDGVAPEIHFVVQDIDSNGRLGPPADLRDPFWDAYAKGARVHTNSWGSFGNSYSTDSQQIDDFMWSHQDFLILFAAGNWGGGPNAGSLIAEATAKNALTVGGTVSYPGQESLAGFSSKGPTPGGRRKPEVTAPATGSPEVTSAGSGTTCDFVGMSGTSMATPAVAGSAILARQYYVDGYYPSGAASVADGFVPSAALVKATLIAGADDMSADPGGSRPNNSQGWGRVHLDNALSFAGDTENLLVLDDRNTSTGFATAGQEDTFQAFVHDPQQPLRAVLVWTDPPAAPGAVDALVNDLDLEVDLRGGRAYAGNSGFLGGFAEPSSGSPDRVNNTEAVMIAKPQAGNATVRVRAFEINDTTGHPQDYALVLVGGVSPGPCIAAAPPSSGSTLVADKAGSGVRLSWEDVGADHAHVYRSESPSGFGPGSAVHADFARDADPATSGIQWDDPSSLGDGASHYYIVATANACHDETP